MTEPDSIHVAFDRLRSLVGAWTGTGKGEFPTIDPFAYSETLIFRGDPNRSFLSYEQSTELIDPHGRPIRKSHWEAGVVRPLQDGSVEISCVQSSGRMEILRGQLTLPGPGSSDTVVQLRSTLVANDDRVRSSSREWSFGDDHFRYSMSMVTQVVGSSTFHVGASLSRQARS